MTAMTVFILAAALLILVILGILLSPLLFAAKAPSEVDRREANLGIFRDQLGELERDRDTGALSEADFQQVKSELQRRLLEEVPVAASEPAARASGGRKTALALLVAVPLAAAAGYMVLGQPQAIDPVNTQAHVSAQQIDAMLAKLVDRLKANPDDAKGWIILARSYKALGRYAESAEAFGKGSALLDSDAALLSEYADVLLQISGGNFAGQPEELVARALKLDPSDPQALFLAGAAARDRNDLPAVVEYWGRLLPLLPPDSQDARVLGEAVAKVRASLGEGGTAVAAAPAKADVPAPATAPATGAEAISGDLMLSGKIAGQARPDDTLFVFARPDEGSRMPLAVMRMQVADLPLAFSLDDTMALPGGQKISQFETVTLEARVAKSGMAQSASGDLFGSIKGIKPGSTNIKLVIDQVQP
jgi:cytochrome c-type biogenesis protein CcmH